MSAAATNLVLPAPAGRISRGWIATRRVGGESSLVRLEHQSPLKLLAPRASGDAVWAYAGSFGGGLVGGDHLAMDLDVGAASRLWLGTQASTKVYRCAPGLQTRSSLTARVETEATLVLAPESVSAFAGSSYAQSQSVTLEAGSGLVLLDWFSSGRYGCGERWDMAHLESRTEIHYDGRLAFLETLLLSPDDGPLCDAARMGLCNCLATLLVLGPAVSALSQGLLARTPRGAGFDALVHDPLGRVRNGRIPRIWSAISPHPLGAMVRCAAAEVQDIQTLLSELLGPLSASLGGDPWRRKW